MAGQHRTRGDYLLSPVFLTSLGILLVNDFLLKPNYPSPLSGILSDLAGMVFFPIFFVAVVEFLAVLLPGRPFARPRWFWIATAVIAFLLVVVKFTDVGQEMYRALVAPLMNTPIAGLTIGGGGAVSDPWDLLALFLAPIPIWVGWRYRGQENAAPTNGSGILEVNS